MELAQSQQMLRDRYLGTFAPLIGDKRTDRALRGTVQGIIGAESLACSRSPKGTLRFSPWVGDAKPQWRAAG